jgi:hypothetical protein
MAKPKDAPLELVETVVVASVAVLGVAALLWFIFPKARPAIAAAVIASPIPPIP